MTGVDDDRARAVEDGAFADLQRRMAPQPPDLVRLTPDLRERWPSFLEHHAHLMALIRAARTPEERETALTRAGRDRGPDLLTYWIIAGRLADPVDLAAVLAQVWTMAESPQAYLGQRGWVGLFRQAGFITDAEPRPAAPVTVYKGSRRHGSRGGMAWTDNPVVASSFAANLAHGGGASTIYAATIDPEHILAIIRGGRGEDELVVDPRHLRGIHELPVVTPAEVERWREAKRLRRMAPL